MYGVKMRVYARVSLTLLYSVLCIALFAEESAQETPRPMRVGIRHIESGGIGYNQGYTTLERFFFTDPPLCRCVGSLSRSSRPPLQ